MNNIEISPSILSADFNKMREELDSLVSLGIKYIHFDVMDGNFVNNISFGIPVLKSLKKGNYPLLFDVHLMITKPLKYAVDFLDGGADILTFHYEAVTKNELAKLIDIIHSKNKLVGISIKPNTKPQVLLPYLDKIDLVLVMSVEPGFGGQKFMVESLEKIKFLANYKKEKGLDFIIEVDGGINEATSKDVILAGANMLVAGSYIFSNNDRKKAIDSLK